MYLHIFTYTIEYTFVLATFKLIPVAFKTGTKHTRFCTKFYVKRIIPLVSKCTGVEITYVFPNIHKNKGVSTRDKVQD